MLALMERANRQDFGTVMQGLTRSDEHAALVDPRADATVTYAELHAAVERLAGGLTAGRLGPGDVVAMALPNGPPFVLCFLAIVAMGATAAPLNPAYTAEEFTAYLRDLRPRAMVLAGETAAPARRVCSDLEIAVVELAGSQANAVTLGSGNLTARPSCADPDAVALLLHTSGTTSRPKGVPLRQRNLAASMATIAASYRLTTQDTSYCVMPLFHVHGLVASTLATLASGGTVVVPERVRPGAFWGEVVDRGATWFSAVPTIHRVLVDRAHVPQEGGHPLRFARACSSALPTTLAAEAEDRFGIPLVEAYGMTEAAHQMASNPLPPGTRRHGTVGTATGTQMAILDEEWRQLEPGRVGEVAVRGPGVIDGYRDAPEADATSFRDGWFRTGDSGRLSDDGYLTLEGRIKELINRAGEKISPHEVEEALLSHPAVIEAVAYGTPDAKYGESVAAVLVVADDVTDRDLRRHCGERLAAFKVPASIARVDTIPKGPTGKVQRRTMASLIGS